MKRLSVLLGTLLLILALSTTAFAQDGTAQVRVVHASPDAPAVDVLVNGSVAFGNVSFGQITDYTSLDTGSYNVQVAPAGAQEPIVIDTDVTLEAQDYTIVAIGRLADIEPLVLVDDTSAPAPGEAKVRIVHASPDAPAVDIAVQGGPVLFENVAFGDATDYLAVDAGTYDLEVRLAGTDTVALAASDVTLTEGTVYNVFAVGLVNGEPTLRTVISSDELVTGMLPETGSEGTPLSLPILTLGALLIGGGLAVQFGLRRARAK